MGGSSNSGVGRGRIFKVGFYSKYSRKYIGVGVKLRRVIAR